MRRIPALVAILVLLAALAPATMVVAAPQTLTGTLVTKAKIALTPAAVAVITLVDQQASPSAGSVVSQQRINAAQLPQAFSVAYDDQLIDKTHSYALFASVIDGTSTYQSVEPVPVITGGPTSNISINLVPPSTTATGAVTGTIARNDKSALSDQAVAIVALVRQDKGTLVARQVIPVITKEPIPFSVAYDPGVIVPTVTYVVRAGIVDGSHTWNAREGVPGIVNGTPVANLAITVAPTIPSEPPTAPPSSGPTATPKPTAGPTATPKPTPKPTPTATPKPTPKPSATPTAAPTATPTAAPTATPTAAPTAAPSATPTAAPTAVPSASAAASPSVVPSASAPASPSPTAAPTNGTISGTLTWDEDHEPSADARAVVLLMEGTSGPTQGGTIIATFDKRDPGNKPIKFQLTYLLSSVTPGTPYRLYAGLVDGDLAWVTPIGVSVDVSKPVIEGVELPLAFRPDLLKGAVGGTITGVGLDPARDPDAYGTALIIRVDTGETVGFQLLAPVGAAPVPFEVPYDPTTLDPNADYVARGSMWDGTTLWAMDAGVPVITKGNANSGVVLTVTEAVTPQASPSAAPATAAPAPTPAPSPAPEDTGRPASGLLIFAILGAGGLVLLGVLAYLRSRK